MKKHTLNPIQEAHCDVFIKLTNIMLANVCIYVEIIRGSVVSPKLKMRDPKNHTTSNII